MAWDHKEYWIFFDESVQDGALFSNFFGGIILPQPNHAALENRLRAEKAEIGFLKVLKWQRVTEHWLEGYQRMMTAFFDILRVMFRGGMQHFLIDRSLGDEPPGLEGSGRDRARVFMRKTRVFRNLLRV